MASETETVFRERLNTWATGRIRKAADPAQAAADIFAMIEAHGWRYTSQADRNAIDGAFGVLGATHNADGTLSFQFADGSKVALGANPPELTALVLAGNLLQTAAQLTATTASLAAMTAERDAVRAERDALRERSRTTTKTVHRDAKGQITRVVEAVAPIEADTAAPPIGAEEDPRYPGFGFVPYHGPTDQTA